MYTRSLITIPTVRQDKKVGQNLSEILYAAYYDFGLFDRHQMEQLILEFIT